MSDQPLSYYHQKLKNTARGRIAVYIDVANLEKSVADLRVRAEDMPANAQGSTDDFSWRINYRKMKKVFQSLGPLTAINFYTPAFESEGHKRLLGLLQLFGYRIVKKPLKLYADHTVDRPHRKANFDVEIAVDAVTDQSSDDTIILFSGDSDFVYLLNQLRGRGKQAILFSRKGHVAKELFSAIDAYFDIVDFRKQILRMVPYKSPKPRT